MPKRTPSKAKKHEPRSVLSYSMEGFGILTKEGKKGYKWAAQRIKKDLKSRK